MGRIVPNHFRRDGQAKRAYPTKDAAKKAALRYHANAYRCEFCGNYHIGGNAR